MMETMITLTGAISVSWHVLARAMSASKGNAFAIKTVGSKMSILGVWRIVETELLLQALKNATMET